MSGVLVQTTKSSDSPPGTNDGAAATVATAAFASSTTSGNLISGAVSFQGTSTWLSNVKNAAGVSATIVDRVSDANGLVYCSYFFPNITGASGEVITANFSPNVGYRRISAQEFSGLATTGQPNQHASNTSASFGTGTDFVTSGAVTTTATCTIWGAAYDDTSATVPSVGTGFTSADSATFSAGDAFRVEYKTGAASGSQAATFTTTAGTDVIDVLMMAFEEAGGGGGGPTIDAYLVMPPLTPPRVGR